MIATQPKQADFDQRTPILAVGVDNGHGLLKVVLDADSRQMKVRCPSKFKELREDLLDYQNDCINWQAVASAGDFAKENHFGVWADPNLEKLWDYRRKK